MARPNNKRTEESTNMRIHKNLIRLLKARRMFLINDGQKFAERATLPDISKEFVEHYWNIISFSKEQKKMWNFYNKCSKNI